MSVLLHSFDWACVHRDHEDQSMNNILNIAVVSMTLAVGLAVSGCDTFKENQPTSDTTGGATTGGVTSRGGIGGNGIDGSNTLGGTGDMGDPVDSGMTGIGGDFDGTTGAPIGGGR
jgi:hypothetical protein